MTRKKALLFGLFLACALTACNTLRRQPQLRDTAITPAEVKPGDSAVISTRVMDRHDIVKRVEGIVLEDPRMTFRLKDDGIPPDAAAGDHIWSLAVDVPFQAPPGTYTLEFSAYNSKGNVIRVRSREGGEVPLSGRCSVVIHYPPQP